jgi:hypothetical protein
MNTLPLPEQPDQADKPKQRSVGLLILYSCLFWGVLIPFAIIFALFATCWGVLLWGTVIGKP